MTSLTSARSSEWTRCTTESIVGLTARSYSKIRKVSSDQTISPVSGLHPKLPVWLSLCASARYASRRRSS
jgi:hypothetical protein